MDTNVDEGFLPVEFTEMWFPLEATANVMNVLLDLYQDQDRAGTFAAELYTAKSSPAWLSPAYERRAFRVDLFWFQKNSGDPVRDYYPEFYRRLQHLGFRLHWGKYLPEPGSPQDHRYLRRQYPRWKAFLRLRERLDPRNVFLSTYWGRHLGTTSGVASSRVRPPMRADGRGPYASHP